jgi:hypothetical protein
VIHSGFRFTLIGFAGSSHRFEVAPERSAAVVREFGGGRRPHGMLPDGPRYRLVGPCAY